MDMKDHILAPFLLGQRRDGLCRICEIDHRIWEVLALPDFKETEIIEADEKIRRMGKIYSLLGESVMHSVMRGRVPMSIAGDCFSALGVLGGLQKAGKPPDRILWLDAHGDFHTWETTQTKYLGGMPLAVMAGRHSQRQDNPNSFAPFIDALGIKPYPEEKIVLSDARDLDPGEIEALHASQIVTCRIDEIFEHLPPNESLQLHFDTDVMDGEVEMPALKYHVKQGPTYFDMQALFRRLRSRNIVAISVSAWHPDQDADNKTATACLNLLRELE